MLPSPSGPRWTRRFSMRSAVSGSIPPPYSPTIPHIMSYAPFGGSPPRTRAGAPLRCAGQEPAVLVCGANGKPRFFLTVHSGAASDHGHASQKHIHARFARNPCCPGPEVLSMLRLDNKIYSPKAILVPRADAKFRPGRLKYGGSQGILLPPSVTVRGPVNREVARYERRRTLGEEWVWRK